MNDLDLQAEEVFTVISVYFIFVLESSTFEWNFFCYSMGFSFILSAALHWKHFSLLCFVLFYFLSLLFYFFPQKKEISSC